jgi:ABC-type amino acid transport system permease subunit
MEPIHLTTKELFLYLALIGAAVGLILGLINLLIATRRGKKSLGRTAIPVCIILGVLSPVLAFIAFGVFLWLTFSDKRGVPEVVVVNEEPIEVSTSDPKDS